MTTKRDTTPATPTASAPGANGAAGNAPDESLRTPPFVGPVTAGTTATTAGASTDPSTLPRLTAGPWDGFAAAELGNVVLEYLALDADGRGDVLEGINRARERRRGERDGQRDDLLGTLERMRCCQPGGQGDAGDAAAAADAARELELPEPLIAAYYAAAAALCDADAALQTRYTREAGAAATGGA